MHSTPLRSSNPHQKRIRPIHERWRKDPFLEISTPSSQVRRHEHGENVPVQARPQSVLPPLEAEKGCRAISDFVVTNICDRHVEEQQTRSDKIPICLRPADFAGIRGGATSKRFETGPHDVHRHLGVADGHEREDSSSNVKQ